MTAVLVDRDPGQSHGSLVPQRPRRASERILYAPVEASIGDGLKVGCGFSLVVLAIVVFAFLVGVALIVLTVVLGSNAPASG